MKRLLALLALGVALVGLQAPVVSASSFADATSPIVLAQAPAATPAPAAAAPAAAAPADAAAAPAAAPPAPNKGDNAWMIVATLLVIMMSIPGLALFYGGLVRSKNMLSILMQVFVIFSMIVVLWAVYGYSLAFTEGGAFIGGFDRVLLSGIFSIKDGVGAFSTAATFSKGVVIPEYLFIVFQATFAAITVALIVGVQDAYSLRCMPAVHGATKMSIQYAIRILETEANSSTDNPLVFADEGKILSCGNFHGMPVAHAMDFAAISISSLASISHERISKFISTQMSDLPPFLATNGGLNSGHMIVQVASASLVSENKVLAHPASVDSMPTSAEKEDHVSMGTIAARKFSQIVKNAQNVLAMEFLSATQALDMLLPLKPTAGVLEAYAEVRKDVPYAKVDRIFSKDVEKIRNMILQGSIIRVVEAKVGHLEL